MNLREALIWHRVRQWHEHYNPELIAVTGSIGKTTTKSAITLALSTSRNVRMAQQPYTRPLDVALGLLGIDESQKRLGWLKLLAKSTWRELEEVEPDTVVLEYGADKPGDLDLLAHRLSPDVLVVTSIEHANTEQFVSMDMIAHEMTALVVAMKSSSTLVLNADDERVMQLAERASGQVVTFGVSRKADVQIEQVQRMPRGGLAIHLFVRNKRHAISVSNVVGKRQVRSLAAALGVAYVAGLDTQEVAQRLQQFYPPTGRMERIELPTGATLLNDSYTATPESMKSALHTLAEVAGNDSRTIAVIGDIDKLARERVSVHEELGRYASQVADIVILVGENMRTAGTMALQHSAADIHHFETALDAAEWLPDYVGSNDVLLVCGSRKVQLDRLVEVLKELSA